MLTFYRAPFEFGHAARSGAVRTNSPLPGDPCLDRHYSFLTPQFFHTALQHTGSTGSTILFFQPVPPAPAVSLAARALAVT